VREGEEDEESGDGEDELGHFDDSLMEQEGGWRWLYMVSPSREPRAEG
jgi:hypothetical protein